MVGQSAGHHCFCGQAWVDVAQIGVLDTRGVLSFPTPGSGTHGGSICWSSILSTQWR